MRRSAIALPRAAAVSSATGGGATASFDDDIVFRDGRFEQWPEGTQQ